MAFGEETRLLQMRILQNFVRDQRGVWDSGEWEALVGRVRRLGFESISAERMHQLSDGNRERWLAGENEVGPQQIPAPAAPAAAGAPAAEPSGSTPLGAKPPEPLFAAAQETQSIEIAGIVEEVEAAADDPKPVQTMLSAEFGEAASGASTAAKRAAKEPAPPKAKKPSAKKPAKKSAKKPAKKKSAKESAKKSAKKPAKKKQAAKKRAR